LFSNSSTAASGAVLGFQRQNGAGAVTNGFVLGSILFSGYDGSVEGPTAQIRSVLTVRPSCRLAFVANVSWCTVCLQNLWQADILDIHQWKPYCVQLTHIYNQWLWHLLCSLDCNVCQVHCNQLEDEVQAHDNLFSLYYKPGLACMLLFAHCMSCLVDGMLSEPGCSSIQMLQWQQWNKLASSMASVLRCVFKCLCTAQSLLPMPTMKQHKCFSWSL